MVELAYTAFAEDTVESINRLDGVAVEAKVLQVDRVSVQIVAFLNQVLMKC